MSNLWPRIEPLLARVEKPARYIGMERGSRRPEHRAHQVAWLLLYPDAYEIGLPNQGLQILYEILNERDDAVAERAYAPWVDLEGELRASGVPLFSVDTYRAAADFDVLAFNLSAELVYTNVLSCIDLAGVPVRAAARAVDAPLVIAGGHCAFNPEPLADFVDAFVIGDGDEPGRLRAGDVRRRIRRSAPRGRHAEASRRSHCCRQADRCRPRRLAVPEAAARPAHRSRARPPQCRDLPRLHARLPVLPGRDDHAAGARAAARAGAHDGRRRPASHRLRRSRAHVIVERRL